MEGLSLRSMTGHEASHWTADTEAARGSNVISRAILEQLLPVKDLITLTCFSRRLISINYTVYRNVPALVPSK